MPCGDGLAVAGGNGPAVAGIVEHQRLDVRVELNVFAQIMALDHGLQVGEDVGLVPVSVLPVPSLEHFFVEGVLIDVGFGVPQGAGIFIPVFQVPPTPPALS